MAIETPKMIDPRVSTLWRNIRIVTRKQFDRLLGVRKDFNARDRVRLADELYAWFEEVRKAIASLYQNLDVVYAPGAGSLVVAFQRLVTSSDTLSTTSVANDTIEVQSQTPYEFNFQDDRRWHKVQVGPIEGKRSMGMVFDADHLLHDRDDYAGMVFPVEPRKLQRVGWNGAAWEGVAWWDGVTIDLIQLIPSMMEEL